MPALSPEQRKRQRQLQIQREQEYAQAMAPKPGSKTRRSTVKGAATKGETVGGAKPQAKPKPPVEANKPREYYGPGGKAQPAEKKPATPPVKATAQRTTVMPRNPSPAPKAKAEPKKEAPAAAQSYRDKEDVKGLSVGRYRTLSEHLAAVQANKAMKIGSKMDTKSDVYTPSTKVDGSKMDTSKVTAKTEEYDKKKRKKLS